MSGLLSLLNSSHVACHSQAKSQKNIFELLARKIAQNHPAINEQVICKQLLNREKLGSTGLGEGVAVPHSRIEGLEQPIGFLVTLECAVPFDAPDGVPVDVLFALLVPEDSTQVHLDLLAEVATLFSDPKYCKALREAATPTELLANAISSQVA